MCLLCKTGDDEAQVDPSFMMHVTAIEKKTVMEVLKENSICVCLLFPNLKLTNGQLSAASRAHQTSKEMWSALPAGSVGCIERMKRKPHYPYNQ